MSIPISQYRLKKNSTRIIRPLLLDRAGRQLYFA